MPVKHRWKGPCPAGDRVDQRAAIVRQPIATPGDVPVPEMLQRARIVRRALGQPARRRVGVDQHRTHAEEIQIHREHQPNRTPADDRHGCRHWLVWAIQDKQI